MSQLSLVFDASLMIRDEQGRYLPATAEQILDAARKVIDQKVQRGAAFTSSELVNVSYWASVIKKVSRSERLAAPIE